MVSCRLLDGSLADIPIPLPGAQGAGLVCREGSQSVQAHGLHAIGTRLPPAELTAQHQVSTRHPAARVLPQLK